MQYGAVHGKRALCSGHIKFPGDNGNECKALKIQNTPLFAWALMTSYWVASYIMTYPEHNITKFYCLCHARLSMHLKSTLLNAVIKIWKFQNIFSLSMDRELGRCDNYLKAAQLGHYQNLISWPKVHHLSFLSRDTSQWQVDMLMVHSTCQSPVLSRFVNWISCRM